jgi:hypothetical protein
MNISDLNYLETVSENQAVIGGGWFSRKDVFVAKNSIVKQKNFNYTSQFAAGVVAVNNNSTYQSNEIN